MISVWKGALQLYLWHRTIGLCGIILPSEFDGRFGRLGRRHCQRLGLLSVANGRTLRTQHSYLTAVSFFRSSYVNGERCQRAYDCSQVRGV